MGTTPTTNKHPLRGVLGNGTDMVLVDTWLRGVLQSAYGSRWEAIYKQTSAHSAFRMWAGLLTAEA